MNLKKNVIINAIYKFITEKIKGEFIYEIFHKTMV